MDGCTDRRSLERGLLNLLRTPFSISRWQRSFRVIRLLAQSRVIQYSACFAVRQGGRTNLRTFPALTESKFESPHLNSGNLPGVRLQVPYFSIIYLHQLGLLMKITDALYASPERKDASVDSVPVCVAISVLVKHPGTRAVLIRMPTAPDYPAESS